MSRMYTARIVMDSIELAILLVIFIIELVKLIVDFIKDVRGE